MAEINALVGSNEIHFGVKLESQISVQIMDFDIE